MSIPLLAGKLYIPSPRPNLVPRPRLSRRLDEAIQPGPGGAHGRLVLISAPPGFGKTTLLAEWLHARRARSEPGPVAWLSLDERDNDPSRFWTYLLGALASPPSGDDRASVALRADVFGALSDGIHGPPLSEDALTALANAVAGSGAVLVLDDYHAITTASIHEAIAFLLAHAPASLHLVLATRADPPLLLARLRAQDRLVELRADDLRFTEEESADFLNHVMGLALSSEAVHALEARTEGWIAGLQLAALSMRDRSDTDGFIRAFAGTHRYIMDYLLEQVLQRQPPARQAFLLETSILDRLTAALCDEVTGAADAQDVLHELDAANLFIVGLDDERRWYRYHPLFAELLRNELRKTYPGRVQTLHLRAASWCEAHGLMDEAVHHALEARDYQVAERLIGLVRMDMIEHSRLRTLLNWFAALPRAFIHSRPGLCMSAAWVYAVNGQFPEALRLLEVVEQHLGMDWATEIETEPARDLAVELYIINGFIARFMGDSAAAVALTGRALSVMRPGYLRRRGVTLLFHGHAHLLCGDLASAEAALTESRSATRESGHVAAHLSAVHYLAQLRLSQGRLRDAQALYQEAQHYVASLGRTVLAGIESIGAGDLLREQDRLEEAARLINEGLKLAEAGGDFVFLRDGYIAAARLEAARDDFRAAHAFIDRSDAVAWRSPASQDVRIVAAWRVRLWLVQVNRSPGVDAVQALTRLWQASEAMDDAPGPVGEFLQLTRIRALLMEGRPDRVVSPLNRLADAALAAGRNGSLIEIFVLQALVAQMQGDMIRASAILRRALTLAEPEGYRRIFLDEGERMVGLLAWGLHRGAWRQPQLAAFAAGLLARLGGATPALTPAANGFTAADGMKAAAYQSADPTHLPAALFEPLSDRELEVLQLVAAGATNQEVADRLMVSVNTVRTHLRSIYDKLQVGSRTHAVARARALGWLR